MTKNRVFETPKGFTPVKWKDVEPHEEVYIVGTNNKQPYAYGPHKVFSTQNRKLINSRDQIFPEPGEYLLKKI